MRKWLVRTEIVRKHRDTTLVEAESADAAAEIVEKGGGFEGIVVDVEEQQRWRVQVRVMESCLHDVEVDAGSAEAASAEAEELVERLVEEGGLCQPHEDDDYDRECKAVAAVPIKVEEVAHA